MPDNSGRVNGKPLKVVCNGFVGNHTKYLTARSAPLRSRFCDDTEPRASASERTRYLHVWRVMLLSLCTRYRSLVTRYYAGEALLFALLPKRNH